MDASVWAYTDGGMSMEFNGKSYVLNQCEDIWKWFSESKVGEYTRFFSRAVFHAEDGFYAADSNNLSNYAKV